MTTFLQQTGTSRLARLFRLWRVTAEDFAEAGVGGEGGEVSSSSLVQATTKIFTNAQIQQLPITPLTTVNDPAVDKVLMPIAAMMILDTQAGGYTNLQMEGVDQLTYAAIETVLDYDGNYDIVLQNIKAHDLRFHQMNITRAMLGAPGHIYGGPEGAFAGVFADVMPGAANWAGKGMKIKMYNQGGVALEGGHADNTLTVTTFYLLLDA